MSGSSKRGMKRAVISVPPEVGSTRLAVMVTVAGTGSAGSGGDGGAGTYASLSMPLGVFTSTDGSMYIADTSNSVIRKVSVVEGERERERVGESQVLGSACDNVEVRV